MPIHDTAFISLQTAMHKGSSKQFLNEILIGILIFGVSLCGILLRPEGLLSSFWPANAVLLGVMVRRPWLATHASWIMAIIGFVVADLITGSTLQKSAMLTGCNMAGILCGFFLFKKISIEDRMLSRPQSAIYFMVIVAAASTCSAIGGAVTNVVLFNESANNGFFLWLITEFVNYIALLPIFLVKAPWRDYTRGLRIFRKVTMADIKHAAPFIAFLLSFVVGIHLTGPAAAAFPLPALLWCAVTYSLGTTVLQNLFFVIWTLCGISSGHLDIGLPFGTQEELTSMRLAVTLVALGPFTVASAMACRDQLLQNARMARVAAEEAKEDRALLLAAMTHELRTPLSVIMVASSIMESERMAPLGHPRYVDMCGAIHNAGSHLNELVTDLLDTAKVEASQIDLELKPVNSAVLVEQVARLVRCMAMEREVKLVIEPGEWPDVHIDPRAIKQVLLNLLSNALKFSQAHSSIHLSGAIRGERLVISVKDSGVGIHAEELKHLGRPYMQAGDKVSMQQGTGLGLALSSDLVERHGGKLLLESTPGFGTTVCFDLALATDGDMAGA